MSEALADIARSIAASGAHDLSVWLLGNVPGLPPIVQTVHILSIAAVMGSIVMIDLKVLGLALPSQRTDEMIRRLLPWTWWALLLLLASGLMFVLARPLRYFVNPVFGIKFVLLVPAILLTLLIPRLASRLWLRTMAAASLLLWIGVVLAGRWIAYADYLFIPE